MGGSLKLHNEYAHVAGAALKNPASERLIAESTGNRKKTNEVSITSLGALQKAKTEIRRLRSPRGPHRTHKKETTPNRKKKIR